MNKETYTIDTNKLTEYLSARNVDDKSKISFAEIEQLFKIEHTYKSWKDLFHWSMFFSIPFLILSFVKTSFKQTWWPCEIPGSKTKFDLIDIGIYCGWILIPPIWFMGEYVYNYKKQIPEEQINYLKYCQELASKIWAAVVVSLGVILAVKYRVKPFG